MLLLDFIIFFVGKQAINNIKCTDHEDCGDGAIGFHKPKKIVKLSQIYEAQCSPVLTDLYKTERAKEKEGPIQFYVEGSLVLFFIGDM